MSWQETIAPILKDIFKRGPMIPATPWDEFKRSHFPGWLLRRFPVRYVPCVEPESVVLRRMEGGN